MENTYVSTCDYTTRTTELEQIEVMITGGSGANITKILQTYPHYSHEEISNIIRRVEWFCFLSDDEAHTRTVDGKEFIVRPVFLGGQDAKSAIIKLAEHKTMQDMGFDIPLLDFDKQVSS